jgi:hypothetical protein
MIPRILENEVIIRPTLNNAYRINNKAFNISLIAAIKSANHNFHYFYFQFDQTILYLKWYFDCKMHCEYDKETLKVKFALAETFFSILCCGSAKRCTE